MLNKIEFVVTYACTGRCKHCSEGEHTSCGERIDPHIAADAVRKIASEYDIKTVMTFGGEPLLYPDAVYAIIAAAKERNIPQRQIITNGYFSKNADKIREVVEQLAVCGVNDLLLSWTTVGTHTRGRSLSRCAEGHGRCCRPTYRHRPRHPPSTCPAAGPWVNSQTSGGRDLGLGLQRTTPGPGAQPATATMDTSSGLLLKGRPRGSFLGMESRALEAQWLISPWQGCTLSHPSRSRAPRSRIHRGARGKARH